MILQNTHNTLAFKKIKIKRKIRNFATICAVMFLIPTMWLERFKESREQQQRMKEKNVNFETHSHFAFSLKPSSSAKGTLREPNIQSIQMV